METSHTSTQTLLNDDTIVALATPPGEAGLGVIRCSGPQSLAIGESLFQGSKTPLLKAPSHTLHHGWIQNGSEKIDEVVVAVFRAPHSYTGDDVVEISCHGSPAVLRDVLALCQKKGARAAEPGEFTRRAYLNGKMDLAQAEAVAELIAAQSTRARRAAQAQLEGTLSRRIQEIREPLVSLLAHLEANLDFVEEDIPGLSKEKAKADLNTVIERVDQLLSTHVQGRRIKEGLRISLVGQPNVGKSSLFNALLAEDRAIVTPVPGTTRDTLDETLEWDGLAVVLTDTAGLRNSDDVVERVGTERTQKATDRSDLLFFVLDGTQAWTPQDQAILDQIQNKKFMVLINKRDQKAVLSLAAAKKIFPTQPILEVSALQGSGLKPVQQAVMDFLGTENPSLVGTPILLSGRHQTLLEKTHRTLEKTRFEWSQTASEETVSLNLREALRPLDEITGQSVSDDVLAAIFQQFCIGK